MANGPYDAEWNDNNYIDELFEAGYGLAVKALGRPVFWHSPKPDYNPSWTIYFIGEEDEILKRLKAGWEAWREKHPEPSETEIKLLDIEYEMLELKQAQKKLEEQILNLEQQKALLEKK